MEIDAIEERDESIEKKTGNKEILDPENLENTPDEKPEQETKLTKGAYFSKFPLYGSDYSEYYGVEMENAELWIIENEIILHTTVEKCVDVIAYYSIKRSDKETFTQISDISLETSKTYGFTTQDRAINYLKDDFGCTIEKDKAYSLEEWYECSRLNGYIDFYRDLYFDSLQLNITKVSESGSKAFIEGKYTKVEGTTYTESKIPDQYYQPPQVNASEIYNGNVHITNLGVVGIYDYNIPFGFGDIEAYILPKTIMVHSNVSKALYNSEELNINVVVEFTIERNENSIFILLFIYYK